MKLSPGQRLAIEMLAAQENLTLGGAARIFLDAGIDALRKD